MSGRKKSFVHSSENYDSDFESDDRHHKRAKQDVIVPPNRKTYKHEPKPSFAEEVNKEYGRMNKNRFLNMDAYSRHKEIINHYILSYPGSTSKLHRDRRKDKTDIDVIKENHHFLWNEDEKIDTWEKQLAKKYYDRLFKEYCLADLSLYKKKKIALRWRTEKEVISGKGQFSCGNVKCQITDHLRTWEVNFAYVENKVKKNALVKLRLCPDCSIKLNYCHKSKELLKKNKNETSKKMDSKCDESKKDNLLPAESSSNQIEVLSSEDANKSEEGSDIWKQPAWPQKETEKSRDEEFEEFLTDLLL